jgi:hypothetical protein
MMPTKPITEVFSCTLLYTYQKYNIPFFFLLMRGAKPAITKNLNASLDIIVGDNSVAHRLESYNAGARTTTNGLQVI